MSLRDYLEVFRRAVGRIEDNGFADSIDIKEEIRAGKQVVIKSDIVLVDGSVLHIKEYIDVKYGVEKMTYAYQYQGDDGKLIFRYDNASHRPALRFVDHKHLFNGTIVQSSVPDISDVVDEVIGYL